MKHHSNAWELGYASGGAKLNPPYCLKVANPAIRVLQPAQNGNDEIAPEGWSLY